MLQVFLAGASLAAAITARPAAINLELRPAFTSVGIGASVVVDLFAVPSSSAPESLGSFQAVIGWTPQFLRLDSVSAPQPSGLLALGFFHDAYGINEFTPPKDGEGLLIGLGPLGGGIAPPPSGLPLGTLHFTALVPTSGTPLDLLARASNPAARTLVLDGRTANLDVTGSLAGATVRVVPVPSAASVLLAPSLLMTSRRRRSCGRPRIPGAFRGAR